jgi:hypothetical protein
VAGFYAHRSISNNRSSQPKPQEHTVLGVNQPLIPPESKQEDTAKIQQLTLPAKSGEKRRFWFYLLLNKLL